MGLYAIDCVSCNKPFMWFSGSLDQRCETCVKESEMKYLSEKEKELFTLATDFKNRPGQTKQSITLFKSFIDMLTTINSLREENENLKRMLSNLNKYVMPGETDSGDSARKVYDELIAENERLKTINTFYVEGLDKSSDELIQYRLCKQELLEALRALYIDAKLEYGVYDFEIVSGDSSSLGKAKQALEKWSSDDQKTK